MVVSRQCQSVQIVPFSPDLMPLHVNLVRASNLQVLEAFSLRWLHVHMHYLLWCAVQKGGCIIVDSTRKGKRFPDSMSKTIPIWTCVLNRCIARYRSKMLDNSVTVAGVSSCSYCCKCASHFPRTLLWTLVLSLLHGEKRCWYVVNWFCINHKLVGRCRSKV